MAVRISDIEGTLALGGLVDAAALGEIADAFVRAHGVGLAVLDAGGFALVERRVGASPIDALAAAFPRGAEGLAETHEAIRTAPLEAGIARVDCFTGLRYLVRPIAIGPRSIGRVILGPYVPAGTSGLPPELTAAAPALDAATAEALLARVKRLDEAQATPLVDLLAATVTTLASRAPVSSGLLLRAAESLGPLSHELRSPLTTILGYADMLLEGVLGPLAGEQREAVATMLEQSESLLFTLNALLDLASAAARPTPLARAPTHISELVVEAMEAVAAQARRKGVTLRAEVDPALPRLAVDRKRLRDCLVQLLANAVKFNRAGGLAAVEVRRAQGDGDWLELSVVDGGIGIPPEELERIFDPFYQVDRTAVRIHSGAGLGLALVRAHVDAHGGTIAVESRAGHGSRFTVRLPWLPG